jgi:PPK2 family polyphosphate:nucleotide phosphotransferase
MMKSLVDKFKIVNGADFKLKNYDTAYTGDYIKDESGKIVDELIKKTVAMQDELYADKKYSLLIIFQAMDAAGKDSAIAHTMSGLNPQGCQVFSFKQPSAEEYEHDFLWRHYRALPERGRIGIHNRSHYENVLVAKVHPELVLKENLPGIGITGKASNKFWKQRYHSIREFEKHLHRNGTIIIKFFLHLSKGEQRKRFLQRIDDPTKNWKFSANDVTERQYWGQYMKAYEKTIKETATPENPWYVIPADNKWFTRIVISEILLRTISDLKLSYPILPKTEKEGLLKIKASLEKE